MYNMKTFLALFACTVVIITVNAGAVSQYFQSEFAKNIKRYCGLSSEGRDNFDSCIIRNGHQSDMLLYKNCAQQVKFFLTLRELDEHICYRRTDEEYLEFLSCFIPGAETANRANPSLDPIIKRCLSREEKREAKKGHHPYQEYVL